LNKKNILFVGAFNKRNNKDVLGGQLFACKSILESNLTDKYNFIELDTCQRSIPPPNILIRIYDSLVRLLTMFRMLVSNKFDFALLFTSDGLGFIEKGIMIIICKKIGIKTILYPRSGLIVNDVKNLKFQTFLKYVLKNTNVLITQGESWLEFYKKFITKNTIIRVQQNWINLKKYKFENREFQKKKINILFLGWTNKEKGVFDLLLVFKKIVDTESRFTLNLFIAGKGHDYDLLEAQIKQFKLFNNVKLLGWVNETKKIKLLKKTDIYVCPSYFEGFPNSLLECMASGIPSIATCVGSIPDVIIHDYNGLLYNSGDNDKLEYLLMELIRNSNLREKLSINSKNCVKRNNTIESASETLDKIFSEI
jgi:glycosyltransferase involved in cell wall biosynthesis